MTARALPTRQIALTLALTATIYACAVMLAGSRLMHEAPGPLALGISLDLTVTVGVVVYLLLIRPGLAPRAALVPVMLLGVLTASRLVPDGQAHVVVALGLAWALLELTLSLVVVARIRRVVRVTRAARRRGLPRLRALTAGLTEALGHARLAELVTQELAALYYGLFGLLRRAPRADGHTSFSHHRAHPWGAVVFGLIVITLGECLALHIVLRQWSPLAAGIVTALHAYSLLWLLGDYQSMRHRPIVLDAEERTLRVSIGFRLYLDVSLDDIAWIGTDASQAGTPDHTHVRGTVMGDPNLLLRFRTPQTATVLFGRRRPCTSLDLRVDRPGELVRAVQAHTRDA